MKTSANFSFTETFKVYWTAKQIQFKDDPLGFYQDESAEASIHV